MSVSEKLVRDAFQRSGRRDDPRLAEAIKVLNPIGFRNPKDDAYWAIVHTGLIADHDTLLIEQSGVDPALQGQMKALFDTARRLKEQAQVKERAAYDLARAAIASKKGVEASRIELSSFHACDGSPTGHCAYDLDGEHGTDECMFCGQPDERL